MSRDQKRPNEVDAWTIAIGNIPNVPPFLLPKRVKQALEIVSKLEGLYGINPNPPHGTLLLFKTKNLAIRAKNELEANHIQVGHNICHCYVDKRFLKEGDD